MARLGKNTARALRSAKSVDELIEKFVQPDTHNHSGNTTRFNRMMRNNKPYCSEYYGLFNPTKLNISSDTLKKIK